MRYTKLGPTGTSVSEICLGTWRFAKQSPNGTVEISQKEANTLLDTAWENGINFIDTANIYGDPNGTAERWIGEWLTNHDRDDFVLASKVYFPMGEGVNNQGLSRKHIRNQIGSTLDRLNTNYIDIYYIHRWDSKTHIIETLSTLNDLVYEGKIQHLGASAMSAWQLTKALWKSDSHELEQIKITQPRYNAVGDTVADYHPEYLEVCADQDLAVCPYSPLAGGFLTGKYQRDGGELTGPDDSRANLYDDFSDWYIYDHSWEVLNTVREIADEINVTSAQVALQWLLSIDKFTCIPIVGARTPAQLKENINSIDTSLSSEHIDQINNAQIGNHKNQFH